MNLSRHRFSSLCEVHGASPEVIMISWKNPQWHFNVVFISFGLYSNLTLPKTEYFPVVILWLRFLFGL